MDRRMMTMRGRRIDDIILLTEELIRSIKIESDLWGEVVDNDEEEKQAAKKQSANMDHPMLTRNSEKGNSLRDMCDDEMKREKVMRMMDLAVQELGDQLYPYTKIITRHPDRMAGGVVVSDMYRDPEMWHIQLEVPQTFSPSTTGYLRTLAHEYVVARVIEDWVAMFVSEKAAIAINKVEAIRAQIAAARDRRTMGVRRRGSVY